MSDPKQINDGGPAFPCAIPLEKVCCSGADERRRVDYINKTTNGMTLRAYAAIKLRVPESGIDWLDDMIRKAQRDWFAGQALAGLSQSHQMLLSYDQLLAEFGTDGIDRLQASKAFRLADAMLAAGKEKV